jgi:signal transduction histidine kinase
METIESTRASHNLLIIDDEIDIVKALRRQFRRHYNIYVANSAAAGYEIMTEVPIHVIISDQRMPGMSGVEFFHRVKHEFPDAIRLLLTGYADLQSVIAAINDGNVFRYIGKPWNPEELDTIVREACIKHDLILENRSLLQKLQEANHSLEHRVFERTTELHQVNEQLRLVNAQKDRFMGMVAHDLRGPIGSIQMCAELLRALAPGAEEQIMFTSMIEETAHNALYLINDLLDVATIESGNLIIEPKIVDLPQLIERIGQMNRLIAERKGIQLTVDCPPTLTKARFDPRRIEQVLDNLLSNAFKYSHQATTVTLRFWADGADLIFAVSDQGQGIPPADLQNLFKSFHRASTRPTGTEKSTGLGLAICKRIIELHHGEILVESVMAIGTTFTIRLRQSLSEL